MLPPAAFLNPTMPRNRLIFQDAEIARNTITRSQRQEVERLYIRWADEIQERIHYYERRQDVSSQLRLVHAKQLRSMMDEASEKLSRELYPLFVDNMRKVSQNVFESHLQWMANIGFRPPLLKVKFANVPEQIIERIVSGKIYQSGWSLSASIWTNHQHIQKKAYEIVAGGIAQNKPIYKIAQDLQKWVDPRRRKPWNLVGANGRRIYPYNVDYCAQRLARTLVQHSYQQSFIDATKDNDLIVDYIWVANGSRACPTCLAMDGKHYPKDALPMDHPQGMCVMVPNLADDWQKRLLEML